MCIHVHGCHFFPIVFPRFLDFKMGEELPVVHELYKLRSDELENYLKDNSDVEVHVDCNSTS